MNAVMMVKIHGILINDNKNEILHNIKYLCFNKIKKKLKYNIINILWMKK